MIEAGGARVLHGGDTRFHGWWWGVRRFVGPIDVALLPINGPVLHDVPGHAPDSPLPAVLTPEEAAVAARLLGARVAIPIHYGALDRPAFYAQTPDAVARFGRACAEQGIDCVVLEPGEEHAVAANRQG